MNHSKMEEQTKQSMLAAGLIVPKQEIIEDVEVTFESEEENKEYIVPKEELSDSSHHPEEDCEQNFAPVKTEQTSTQEISQPEAEQEETSEYIEIKSARHHHAPLYVATGLVIGAVRRRPALWDLSDALYKDREARCKFWAEVFEELFPRYHDEEKHRKKEIEKMVQQRWKTARDAYIRCRNLLKNNTLGQESGRKKVYVYFDEMRFLDKKNSIHAEDCETHQIAPSASNTDTPKKVNHETPISNLYTPTSNRDTHTSNRDTQTSIPDSLITPNRFTPTSNHDTPSYNHVTPSTSNHDTPFNRETPKSNHDTPSASNHLPPSRSKHLDLGAPKTFRDAYSKRLRRVQRKRKQTGTDDFEREMLMMFREHAKLLHNDDLTFFMSLLPITKNFTVHQKLVFRSEILKKAMEIGNMQSSYEATSRPDSSHSSSS